MFIEKKKHTVDVLFVITLFAVFSISVVMLTGTGANVYQNIVNDMSENYDSRTAFTYISNKIHQYDTAGNIDIISFHNQDSLVIYEEIDNIVYATYLYAYDGKLKELFTRADQDFDPSYGTDILTIESFKASKVSGSLYKFDITTADGDKEALFAHIRSFN